MTTSLTRIPAVPAGIDEAIESVRMPQRAAARDPSAHRPTGMTDPSRPSTGRRTRSTCVAPCCSSGAERATPP